MDSPLSASLLVMHIVISFVAFSSPSFLQYCVFHPYSVSRGRNVHTLVLGNLIHADLMHLMFNMMSFYFFAFPLERVLGTERFLVVYMGSMLVANIPSLVKHRNNPDYRTLGASGAVSGIIFSMILFFPTMKMGMFLLPPIIPAYIFGPLYIAGTYYAAKRFNDNINHDAHLWGAFAGLIITLLIMPESLTIFLRALSLE